MSDGKISFTVQALSDADIAYIREALRTAIRGTYRSGDCSSALTAPLPIEPALAMVADDTAAPIHPLDALENAVAHWLDTQPEYAWAAMLRQFSVRGFTLERADRILRRERARMRR